MLPRRLLAAALALSSLFVSTAFTHPRLFSSRDLYAAQSLAKRAKHLDEDDHQKRGAKAENDQENKLQPDITKGSQSSKKKESVIENAKRKSSKDGVGSYDPGESLRQEEVNVGNPQIKVKEKERDITSILRELAAIQQKGPQKYCIIGTRHCSYLHQQIIELLYVEISLAVSIGVVCPPL